MKKNWNRIVDEVIANTIAEFDTDPYPASALARFAACEALTLAGFSDENVPDSPRPVSNSPRNAGKNGEFGPTELR